MAEENLMAVVSEVNIVGNKKGWWIDTGATHPIFNDRITFKNYKMVGAGIKLFMGNSATIK